MNLQTGFTLFHMPCPTVRTSSAAAAEACNGFVVILLLFFFSVIGTLLCYCLLCCCCCEIGKTSENSFLYASPCRLWSLTNFRGKQRVKAAHCMCLCVCVWVALCMCAYVCVCLFLSTVYFMALLPSPYPLASIPLSLSPPASLQLLCLLQSRSGMQQQQ